jgi:hypothetical protein
MILLSTFFKCNRIASSYCSFHHVIVTDTLMCQSIYLSLIIKKQISFSLLSIIIFTWMHNVTKQQQSQFKRIEIWKHILRNTWCLMLKFDSTNCAYAFDYEVLGHEGVRRLIHIKFKSNRLSELDITSLPKILRY